MVIKLFYSDHVYKQYDGKDTFIIKATDGDNCYFTFYTDKSTFELVSALEKFSPITVDIEIRPAERKKLL